MKIIEKRNIWLKQELKNNKDFFSIEELKESLLKYLNNFPEETIIVENLKEEDIYNYLLSFSKEKISLILNRRMEAKYIHLLWFSIRQKNSF